MKEIIDTSQLMDLSEVSEIITTDENGEIALSKQAMQFISQVDLLERWSKDGKKRMQEILKDKMEEYGLKTLKSADITISYKDGYDRSGLDHEMLLKDHPEYAVEYEKITPVKASVSIRRKSNGSL